MDGFAQYTNSAINGLPWHLKPHLTEALKEQQREILSEARTLSCTLCREGDVM